MPSNERHSEELRTQCDSEMRSLLEFAVGMGRLHKGGGS